MELWLFFTIFGCVLFVPSLILFLLFNRFKNTILVIIKKNGTIIKTVITDKILEKGELTQIDKKKIKPIPLYKGEVRYGKWRRWYIIDFEKIPQKDNSISDSVLENYLNSETINMMLLFGKFKDTLLLLIGIGIFIGVVGIIINIYMNGGQTQCILSPNNTTIQTITDACRMAIMGG